jgi:hypothetical protein
MYHNFSLTVSSLYFIPLSHEEKVRFCSNGPNMLFYRCTEVVLVSIYYNQFRNSDFYSPCSNAILIFQKYPPRRIICISRVTQYGGQANREDGYQDIHSLLFLHEITFLYILPTLGLL